LFRVLWPLLVGRPFVAQLYLYWESLEADFTPGAMLISSPAHLSRIPFVEKDAARLSPVAVFSSGGPLSFAAAQDAKAHLGDYPWEVYGSTETGGVAYRQQSQEGKAWQRFDDVTFEILPEGTLGLRSSRLSDDALFETSDLVDLIDEDRFVLKGRADRLVKVEGKRVSLIEVETVLQADPRIAEAYCVLLKDPSLQLAVVVELSATGQQAMVELGPFRMSRDLRKQAAAQLEAAALPKRWRFVEQIPQNAQGKRPLGDILRLFEGLQAKEGPVIDPEILDYRWIDQGVELDLRAPADLHYFKGHFPDVPVLPGVAQLDWAVRYARDAFGGFGAVTEVSQLKYRRLWTPSESVTLRLLHKVEKQAVTFSFATAQAVFSSGTFKVATQ
jgi:3-hydroxymyristoyl/3-hydroxydecanoyl-(acyl carrier protein) dehydratase